MSAKKVRKPPIEVTYGGLPLRVGTYKSNRRVDVSYRHKDSEGNTHLFTREYIPVLPANSPPLVIGEYLSDDVIRATLADKIPSLFLPALFKKYPHACTPDLHLSILGPYVLKKLNASEQSKDSTILHRYRTLNKMAALWGDTPIREVVPERCADDLLRMSTPSSDDCIALLRKIYPLVVLEKGANKVWGEYRQSGRKRGYSHPKRVRSMLLNLPPSPGQICEIINQCVDAIHQNKDAAKHLAALVMISEGILVDEACALRASSLSTLADYKGNFALHISEIVEIQDIPQTDCKKKGKKKSNRIRSQRHIIEKLDAPENRLLGINTVLASCWQMYQRTHPKFKGDQLLLTNPKNHGRVLPPDEFRTWLNDKFGYLFPEDAIAIMGKQISTTYDVADRLRAGAQYLLTDISGFSSEETCYHFALVPQAMDSQHYVGFSAPSELVTMGVMQSMAIQRLMGSLPFEEGTSSKVYRIPGRAEKTSKIHINLDISKLLNLGFDRDLLLRMRAHGYKMKITIQEPGEI